MSLYVLDTDILSLHQRGDPVVDGHVHAHPPSELAITVISVEEQLSGWYTELRRVKQPSELADLYQRLTTTVRFLGRLQILTYHLQAIARYEHLKAAKLNVRKMDLRIAAIALENQAILVTRNTRDFQRVPGLVLEDWTN